ncbi:hypothetical protein DIPPA_00167 [Diplonema papillatum]|nr:hypothetical protein DIPPA_00167 [Diplonema papillatum]
MPPKKEKKKEKKPEKQKKKPTNAEQCECGVGEEEERDPSWAKSDPRRGWVRVVPAAAKAKSKKKKKGGIAAINHNPTCTYQRAPCAKYPHLPKCSACAEGCPKCEKFFADCPDAYPNGNCKKCKFMYKRDVLKCIVVGPSFFKGLSSLAGGTLSSTALSGTWLPPTANVKVCTSTFSSSVHWQVSSDTSP